MAHFSSAGRRRKLVENSSHQFDRQVGTIFEAFLPRQRAGWAAGAHSEWPDVRSQQRSGVEDGSYE